ncbi:HD domain-containing phosphohydrolase [Desulfovibrio sp. JC010]|uniref:HD domain-containing phosphohydrolase n=1 Tax=Desulfovibrio sp. JC010 TaxID=2593641 RepID=UPI001EF23AD5|nr:HD domain-containing phosphohydrolase [Desulfovibrio sp. JC010]NDV28890.1 response regulator [Desulfovibrio sp. JC010]
MISYSEKKAENKLPPRIMVVEDEAIVSLDIQGRLKALGYHVAGLASSGEQAVQEVKECNPDLILMDIMLEGEMDGIDTAAMINRTQSIPIVYLTAYADNDTLKRAKITEPFGYIIKPFEDRELNLTIEMALYKHHTESALKESLRQMNRIFDETVVSLTAMSEKRDPYTSGHQQRVAELACRIAVKMELSSETINSIRIAGILHDVGKISIPAEILSKPTRLTDLEFNLMKTHCEAGYEILKGISFPWPVARIVLQHHERLDGSGYPNGLSGESILQEARIISVADVVEAMSSHRPYRAALGLPKAMAEIARGRGTSYDPEVVDACTQLIEEDNFSFDT